MLATYPRFWYSEQKGERNFFKKHLGVLFTSSSTDKGLIVQLKLQKTLAADTQTRRKVLIEMCIVNVCVTFVCNMPSLLQKPQPNTGSCKVHLVNFDVAAVGNYAQLYFSRIKETVTVQLPPANSRGRSIRLVERAVHLSSCCLLFRWNGIPRHVLQHALDRLYQKRELESLLNNTDRETLMHAWTNPAAATKASSKLFHQEVCMRLRRVQHSTYCCQPVSSSSCCWCLPDKFLVL